jgi:hypothetical protein
MQGYIYSCLLVYLGAYAFYLALYIWTFFSCLMSDLIHVLFIYLHVFCPPEVLFWVCDFHCFVSYYILHKFVWLCLGICTMLLVSMYLCDHVCSSPFTRSKGRHHPTNQQLVLLFTQRVVGLVGSFHLTDGVRTLFTIVVWFGWRNGHTAKITSSPKKSQLVTIVVKLSVLQ